MVINPAGGPIITTTAVGNQDDFAPAGLSFKAGVVSVLRCNNATLLTIRGIANGVDGALLSIISVGAGQVDLSHQNANSAVANRQINFATSASSSLAAGVGDALYLYDGTTLRWRLIHHEQGDWITPAFSAADYTANGSMTWTLQAGDVITNKYYLRGRMLSMVIYLTTTSLGGGANTELRTVVPGGFTSQASEVGMVCDAFDNSATGVFGLADVTASSALLRFYRTPSGSGNWDATSVNNTQIYFTGTIPVA